MQINHTTLEVVQGSVTDQDVDAIVNAANEAMRGGGGIDGRIHRAAGPGLLEELQRIAPDGAPTGSAVMTGGHQLKQRHIIHTPGPRWRGGTEREPELLASCYRSCMQAAHAARLRSLAFCSISTGIYGYPLDHAAQTAIETIIAFLKQNADTTLSRVVLAMYQDQEFRVFLQAMRDAELCKAD